MAAGQAACFFHSNSNWRQQRTAVRSGIRSTIGGALDHERVIATTD
jgi:hypothetical protein